MNGGRNQRGSALIVVLIMVLVLTGLSAFALSGAFLKSNSADQLLGDSAALHMAEAGLDRAIAEINLDRTGDPATDPNSILGTHGPFRLGRGSFTTTVTDWYTDGVDNNGANGPDDSAEQYYYTVVSTGVADRNADVPMQKTVEAIVRRQPFTGFARAMFGKDQVTLGGTVFTDSYDTAFGTYSVQKDPTAAGHLAACPLCSALGHVDASLHADAAHIGTKGIGFKKGDVGSNGPIGDVGTVDLYGNSTSGPGYSTTITSNCYIAGSTAPATAPVPMPSVTYNPPAGAAAVPNNGTTASVLSNSVSLAGGTYRCGAVSLANHQVLQITGNVTLYVDGDIKLTAKEELQITGAGSLTIYHNQGSVQIVGGSNTNTAGKPMTLQVYSASTDGVSIGGNSTFSGCIYAPDADITLAGNTEYFGSVTGQSIKAQGTVDFHYDEALGRMQLLIPGPCEVRSWREID